MTESPYDLGLLPYTLSFPITKALETARSGHYERSKNHLLDFLEMSVMYVSHLLFALMQEGSPSAATQAVLQDYIRAIDHKRPLSFGTWVNELLTPLLQAAETELAGHPLAMAACQTLLEGRKKKKKNVLLGGKSMESVVYIRNHYKGHGTTRSEEKNKEVVDRLDHYAALMLRCVQPLTTATPHEADGHYVLTIDGPEGQRQTLDLFPLAFYADGGVPYIFQTLLDNDCIQYVSSNDTADLVADDRHNRAFDLRMQRTLPAFDIAKEKNWIEIKECIRQQSTRFLNRIYKERKYNQELFVERGQLTQALHRFWDSPQTLFPLIGEAGQGKTNQLCYWTERYLKEGKAVLIFNSADFSGYTLEQQLKMIFDWNQKKDADKLVRLIHQKAAEHNEQVYVFFDAINECLKYAAPLLPGTTADEPDEGTDMGPLRLFQALRRTFIAEDLPRIKVLFTCRTYTWKNLILPTVGEHDALIYHGRQEDETVIRGFTDEEARQAYAIYQQLYQMHTDFQQLGRSIVIRLKDPLILKFVCTNFLGKPLTDDMLDYTSIALFDKMLADIGNSYAGGRQTDIIQLLADHFLQSYLQGQPIDGIALSDIRQAPEGSPLHAIGRLILKDDGISIAYGELLNKAERPVLRETEKDEQGQAATYVQFIYERFTEYVMGRRFIQRMRRQYPEGLIPASAYVESMRQAAVNVVFMGAMRDALIIDYLQQQRPDTIMQLAAEGSDDYNIMSLVTETIDTLIRENHEQQLFQLMQAMLSYLPEEHIARIERFNEVNRLIAANEATTAIIGEHKQLSARLSRLTRLRSTASVGILNGMLLSDFFNENLYRHDAMQLVWQLMTDRMLPVRNDACMYAYYLSNRHFTLDYTPLHANLTHRIVQDMYRILQSHSVPRIVLSRQLRHQDPIFLETATRLCVLLIIDQQEANRHLQGQALADGRREVSQLLEEMRSVVRHFTWNFRVMRLIMPVIQIAMRRQITFQSDYVNNAIEYQGFWQEGVLPATAPPQQWCRARIQEVMSFIGFYRQFAEAPDSAETRAEEARFATYQQAILDAYRQGDALSYFVLERILIIMGTARWHTVSPIVTQFFTPAYRETPWFSFSQMSMLYVLMQIANHTAQQNPELQAIFEREAEDWTRRCRGLFRARNSHKANTRGVYKRNVLTWYAVVYATHTGDGTPHAGDEAPVPLIRRLIDEATAAADKELLYHVIENISELIADFGYIKTGLQLMKLIMQKYDTAEKVRALDAITVEGRDGIYTSDLVSVVGNVFSTAKNYFPAEVDAFIRTEVSGMKFPGVSSYRENILGYTPSGESLSDLFTHKFGKFLIWSLLHEEAVDRFAFEAIGQVVHTPDVFSWFTRVVKILMRHLFGVKL